ncbi:hypothetical protein [Streptomyces buecherae]|uniref:Uncharacterized protein n=1 Tax=Streptomyces buecherae TaxID=2763006 RepID=A0A7H8N7Q1_9ACTN|nr:hypothetical protein [Streptomyces buecherae]QKW50432.1 hypothetical protein HUT08_13835 [Streptomyces buecherae]
MAFLIEHPRELRTLNTQTRFGAGIVLLVAASMTLTACGGDSDSGSDSKDEIKGAESSSAPPPATSTPSSTPMDDGIDRPEIKLPADVNHVFEDRTTGDPEKDTVLADNERNILAEDDAILRADPKSPALQFYNTGEGLVSAVNWVKEFVDADLSFTGTVRYFNRRVVLDGDDKAVLSYCGDESKAYNKDRKTGKVKKSAPSAQSYVLYNSHLSKNEKGVWQVTKLISERGAKACQP